jgi:uncharacterized protein (TIGR03083 family)
VLDTGQQITRLQREGTALADAVDLAQLDRPVPGCPDWTVGDLLRHIGDVHRWAGTIVRERMPSRLRLDSSPASGEGLLDWYRDGLHRLIEALSNTTAQDEFWFWGPAPDALSFWARRQANETAVHRIDVQSAYGTVATMPAEEAVDGLDEWLGLAATRCPVPSGEGRTIHLHATDADGEWLVRLGERWEISTGHAKGDCAVRGPILDLWLWTMNRPVSGLEVFGDESLASLWAEHVRF